MPLKMRTRTRRSNEALQHEVDVEKPWGAAFGLRTRDAPSGQPGALQLAGALPYGGQLGCGGGGQALPYGGQLGCGGGGPCSAVSEHTTAVWSESTRGSEPSPGRSSPSVGAAGHGGHGRGAPRSGAAAAALLLPSGLPFPEVAGSVVGSVAGSAVNSMADGGVRDERAEPQAQRTPASSEAAPPAATC